jgi:hypothetical protein
MIHGIILSKDRAFQCDLLIKSIRANFKEVQHIDVLYTHTNYLSQEAYERMVFFAGKDITFHKEKNFAEDYKRILSNVETDYIINFCDDNVVINNTGVKNLCQELQHNNDVISASLRLHKNYTYCYPAKKELTVPYYLPLSGCIIWDWTKCDQHTCWGYPHPIDSNIYLTEYFKSVVEKCELKTPCIEAEINRKRDKTKPYMIALNVPKIISITHNTAQDWNKNMINSGYSEYSLETLNSKYLSGYTADLQDIMLQHKDINTGWSEKKWRFVKEIKE